MILKKTVNKPQDPSPKIQAPRDDSLGIWDLKFGIWDFESGIGGLELFSHKNLFM